MNLIVLSRPECEFGLSENYFETIYCSEAQHFQSRNNKRDNKCASYLTIKKYCPA